MTKPIHDPPTSDDHYEENYGLEVIERRRNALEEVHIF